MDELKRAVELAADELEALCKCCDGIVDHSEAVRRGARLGVDASLAEAERILQLRLNGWERDPAGPHGQHHIDELRTVLRILGEIRQDGVRALEE